MMTANGVELVRNSVCLMNWEGIMNVLDGMIIIGYVKRLCIIKKKL